MFEPSTASMGTDGTNVVLAGGHLSPREARRIAYRIRKNEGDLRSRGLLLGYYSKLRYSSETADKARSEIILWLIENQPFHPVCRRWCKLTDTAIPDESVLQKAEALWSKQVELFPCNPQVMVNAGWFFYWLRQAKKAKQLLSKAISVEPDNPLWHLELAFFLRLTRMMAPPKRKRLIAQNKLLERELAYKLEKSERVQINQRADLAWNAYQAGEYEKAVGYMQQILGHQPLSSVEDSMSPHLVHHAYLVLGSIALDRGDTKQAIRNLIDSVTEPKPNQYHTLIPDMSLARRLIHIDEREGVLDFLTNSVDVCKVSAKESQKRRDWIKALENNLSLELQRGVDYRYD